MLTSSIFETNFRSVILRKNLTLLDWYPASFTFDFGHVHNNKEQKFYQNSLQNLLMECIVHNKNVKGTIILFTELAFMKAKDAALIWAKLCDDENKKVKVAKAHITT